jgi:16S rRNA G966 N2-methylase RsmD
VAVARLPTLPATILPDAREVQPATLPPGTVAYMDPPYANTTGYGHDLGRAEVCALAERWASAGAWVVISEAEPITELGWPSVEITGERVGQKRTFSRQQREFLTMSKPPRWRPSVQSSLFGGEE